MRTAFALCLALVSTGCFRMTIVNGSAEPAPERAVDNRWRSSAVLDIVAIDVPLGLDTVCAESGWAKIEQRHSALDYLVDVFLAGWVYESTHVDVYCATKAPTPTPSSPPPTPTAPPPTQL